MILIWNNTNSFRQHLEEMRLFCESHSSDPLETAKMLKSMPILYKVKPPHETGLTESLTNNQGNLKIVPIWNITLAKGVQN